MILTADQTWIAIICAAVPLLAYRINARAFWKDEHVKVFVHVVLAGVVAGLYKALDGGHFAWDAKTAQTVLVAVLAALGSHHLLWKPAGVNVLLGARPAPSPERRA